MACNGQFHSPAQWSWNIEGLSDLVAKKFYGRAYRKVGFLQQRRRRRQIYAANFVQASIKAGFSADFDPFDQTRRFASLDQSVGISRTGRRTNSCTAYVAPVEGIECKHNLQVVQGVTVTKIVFNEETPKRAIGIEYVLSDDLKAKHGREMYAKKEVLLAAGPFGSPKTLQLSGIGPKKILRRVGTEGHTDINVGMRVQGRAVNFISSLYTGEPLEPSNNSTILNSKKTRQRWETGKTSVLGVPPVSVINILGRNGYAAMGSAGSEQTLDLPVLTSICLHNPTSFGTLLVKDTDPFSSPNVQLNLLKRKNESNRLRNCLEKMIEVHERFPASFQLSFLSPPSGLNETFCEKYFYFGYHFVGGCAVGSVLERNFTVRGIKGLRVIDASVFKERDFIHR